MLAHQGFDLDLPCSQRPGFLRRNGPFQHPAGTHPLDWRLPDARRQRHSSSLHEQPCRLDPTGVLLPPHEWTCRSEMRQGLMDHSSNTCDELWGTRWGRQGRGRHGPWRENEEQRPRPLVTARAPTSHTCPQMWPRGRWDLGSGRRQGVASLFSRPSSSLMDAIELEQIVRLGSSRRGYEGCTTPAPRCD
jgi:hypothetical protein